jgi:hypothetical protein
LRLLRVRAMEGLILYCRLCGVGYGSVGEIPAQCPNCRRETRWTTSPSTEALASTIMWTREDRRFLRSMRIGAE